MYLNKKNYTGINNTDFYHFFLFRYFDLDILLHDILSQYPKILPT
jgi:hypothetical protein